jgi:hypothetical protein
MVSTSIGFAKLWQPAFGWVINFLMFQPHRYVEVNGSPSALTLGGTRVRKIHTQRYQQQVPGHQIQVDVKFLKFEGTDGKPVKRYQYTAIDDATRIRALKIYHRHNQSNAIDFINTIIDKFPFRIREVRTDNGHEFQAQFHWHVEDLGIRHAYIKPASPQLNGKVERSHRTDEQEFLHRRRRPSSETRGMGAVLQPLPTPWCIQWKGALRGPPRTTIIDQRMSHKCAVITTTLAVIGWCVLPT